MKGGIRMEILDLEKTINPQWWMKKLESCDWTAGQFLHSLVKENRFHELCGEKARILLLADGSRLVSFCTYAERDEIPGTELTPWLGFVYTDPYYRGRRLMGKLISRVKELAREDGFRTLYISTGETGLYEKYGAEYMADMKNQSGSSCRVYRMNTYGFRGWEGAEIRAKITDYPGIETPGDLYNALWHLWERETCAARMQPEWSEDNRTLGQCTITAFLAQDIFGGQVWGIPLGDGNYHCFNVVGTCEFDLTSEQFGDEQLDYRNRREQMRYEHFQKPGKRERYERLREKLQQFTIQNS